MSDWPSCKAREVLGALLGIGWKLKRSTGSHRILERQGYEDYTFAFHDREEIGPTMMRKIAKKTGLKRGDL
jgi:predicted RNA binding protein YcfA (HicA-like mRNA interferase family)